MFSGIGSTAKDIRTALTGVNPDKAAEIELEIVKLEELIETAKPAIAKALADDRASARALGAEYIKAGKTNWRQNILAALAVALLIGLVIAIFWIGVKPEIKDIVLIVLGGVLKIVYDIYGYDFGGSLGSENKNTLIQSIVTKLKGSGKE
jgi:hypothetical protein